MGKNLSLQRYIFEPNPVIKRSLIIFLFINSLCVFAQQDNPDKFYLKAIPHYGFIMEHSHSMGNLIKGHIAGFELDYARPTRGSKLWQYENNFPELGVLASYIYLSNPEQLGSVIAVAPFYDIPLNKTPKRSRLYMRIGSGLAYATKIFDPNTNHKDNVISARLNAYVNFKWFYKFVLSDRVRVETGISFQHASNGKYKAPNLGINVCTGFAGLTLRFKENNPKQILKIDSTTARKSKHELFATVAYGVNETEPPGGPKFLAQSYILGYYFNKRNTHKFGGGFDMFYNQSVIYYLRESDSIVYSNKAKYLQFGMRASYAYNIGHWSFPVEFGYFLHSNFKDDGMFYHRIGARYFANNNIVYSFTLKTHWVDAEYFEFGLGYRIPLKKKR